MILDPKDIKRILKQRPNQKLLAAAQRYTQKLIMHMTGIGLDNYIECMEYFERPELLAIRKKYTRSNKDMFARLHRPIDKIWTARGGSAYYGVGEWQSKKLKQSLANVQYGYNLRKWLEVFWMSAYHYDPMGLIFMEVAGGETYPTYKSVNDIYDYSLDGRNVEYVVFKTDEKISRVKQGQEIQLPVYRLVDDAFDYLLTWDGEEYTVLRKQTFVNYFGTVPARVISDIYDPVRGMYISPDDAIIEIADQYLKEGSILNVFKNYYGFQQKFAYAGVCPSCNGSQYTEGQKCSSCSGTGYKTKYDVSELIILPLPTKEDPVLTPDVAGYIAPDIATWDKQDSSVEALYNLAYATKWNPEQRIQPTTIQGGDTARTATEVVYNDQPKLEALNRYADAAEQMEKFITDHVGNFIFSNSYPGADINYGRRFVIEGPDAILDKLMELITAEAPSEIVREKMVEYYTSLYQFDGVKLNIALKLADVEPLPFYPISKAKDLLPDLEFAKKRLYNDWRSLQSTKNILISATAEALSASLEAYVVERLKKEGQQVLAQ